MKKYFAIIILVASLIISSCNSQAYKIADDYYEYYNSADFTSIKNLCHDKISAQMVDFVKEQYNDYGKIVSFKKYSYSSADEYIILNFKCEFENVDEPVFERISFVKDDNGDLKIEGLVYSKKQWYIDDYDVFIEKSKEAANKYFEFLIDENYTEIVTLLSDDALNQAFIDIINQKNSYYGNVESYELLNVSSYLQDNEPYVVRIYECKTSKSETMYEQINFVRKNDEFLIFDYNYAGSLSDLPD
ncbi:MAG: DUF3887 domain-containing protein [Bacteroidales bacterium]|nr:DUF3887 domain-containing protein [Bacteroidales bacterium]